MTQGLDSPALASGDLAADRRLEWALASAREGDHAGAADLAAQALERAPGFAMLAVKLEIMACGPNRLRTSAKAVGWRIISRNSASSSRR